MTRALDGPASTSYLRFIFAMLSDREADEIERGRRARVVGPIVLKWIDDLLADRRERVQQIAHLRRRMGQAFRYLDGLMREPATPPRSTAATPTCPKCRHAYVRATGVSPQGIVYRHTNGSECRV